ncbi:hypothetical protein BIW11_06061 [Tropilaelaps mercedesae]|uniref:BTB domain-containing protein n=1 Tax=Tropilaelaps mercedesae TaxID=418985 RepID=A0A1V9XZR9_9ACAR|nr:hypothetical protein BIW11_06061 [Tropilaelaps mercedesae]
MEDAPDTSDHLFSLKRNAIHALGILSNLNEQRKNASHYCDVQISTSDQREFWAHKLILDVFTDFFDEHSRFTLSDVDSECMHAFLEFVYTGREPRMNAENALRYMRASIRLGLHQISRIALEFSVENLFDVLSSNYFCSLSFDEFSILPVFEESVALDKLEESKYRRVIRRWVSFEPELRLSMVRRLEALFSRLWTIDDQDRALGIRVDVLGRSNLVQFNFQDGKWYQCEYSCKACNLSENCLQHVQQMALYKKDYFLFRDKTNNIYCSSSELKRIWNKSSTLGTLIAPNCVTLKQFKGQVYAFFDCLKKWNGEMKKFEVVLSKEVIIRQKFTVVDFTLDDRNPNIYLLGSFEASPTKMGLLTVRHGENPFFVSLPEDQPVTSIVTGGDDHLIVYGTNSHNAEGEVFVYDLNEKHFRYDLYESHRLDGDACLFRLNYRMYSMVSTDGEPEHKLYRVTRFPMAIDEEVKTYKYNVGENQAYIKAVCICPSKPYHSIMYGAES